MLTFFCSGYTGGEQKTANDTNRIDVAIAYETVGWDQTNSTALHLAATILGDHSTFNLNYGVTAPATRAYRQCEY